MARRPGPEAAVIARLLPGVTAEFHPANEQERKRARQAVYNYRATRPHVVVDLRDGPDGSLVVTRGEDKPPAAPPAAPPFAGPSARQNPSVGPSSTRGRMPDEAGFGVEIVGADGRHFVMFDAEINALAAASALRRAYSLAEISVFDASSGAVVAVMPLAGAAPQVGG